MNTSVHFLLRIPDWCLAQMLIQARAELPNECCGLLAGKISDDRTSAEVTHRYPLINERASPTEFQSEPRNHLAAERDIRRLGLDVLAVYHTHPQSEPRPSKKDLDRNYSPGVMNVIIGLIEPRPEVRGWWLSETEFQEGDIEITKDAGGSRTHL